MVGTRSSSKTDVEAFQHVLETVLGYPPTASIRTALDGHGYDSMTDLVTMDQEEVMGLEFPYVSKEAQGDEPEEVEYATVPMKDRKRLLHLLWWRDHYVAQQSIKSITNDVWCELTAEEFNEFRVTTAANMARKTSVSGSSGSSSVMTVTSSQVQEFQKGHRRDIKVYADFKGDRRQWFRVKRNWMSNAANDGVADVVKDENEFTLPASGTEAKLLYDQQNRYFYNALQQCVKGGQALIIVREYGAPDYDGRGAFLKMVTFYERAANVSLIKTQCMEEISNMRLTSNYQGGPLRFFQTFQNCYLDLEDATRNTVPDDEKIGALNAALSDRRFDTVRVAIETLALQTGQPIEYASYLQSMITHAENLKAQSDRNPGRRLNRSERGGGGRGSGGRGRGGRGRGSGGKDDEDPPELSQ